jgi:hypothetical protein
METGKKFKTRTGFCHVMDDRIVLTDAGFFNRLADIVVQGEIKRTLALFLFLDILVFYFAYYNYLEGDIFWAGIFALIGLYIVHGIVKGFQLSVHPIIQRDRIREVELIKPIYCLSPPGVEITFLDDKGKRKKRAIFLAGTLKKHKAEVHQALKILREEGILRE